MTHPQTRGSLIPWWIVLLFVAIIVVAIVGLSGCATFDYQWAKTRPAAPKPWRVVEVIDPDFTCRSLGADAAHQLERIGACAQWGLYTCTIYAPKDAPHWMIEHERRHCEGWQHN